MSQELNNLSYIELRRLATKENLKVGSSPTKAFLISTLSAHYKVEAEKIVEVEIVNLPKKETTKTKIKAKVEAKANEIVKSDVSSIQSLAEKLQDTLDRYVALLPTLFIKRIEKSIDNVISKFDEILELETEEVTDEQLIAEVKPEQAPILAPTSQVQISTLAAIDALFDDDELELELQQMASGNSTQSSSNEEDEDEDEYDEEDED
jgi:hypothetical protein